MNALISLTVVGDRLFPKVGAQLGKKNLSEGDEEKEKGGGEGNGDGFKGCPGRCRPEILMQLGFAESGG